MWTEGAGDRTTNPAVNGLLSVACGHSHALIFVQGCMLMNTVCVRHSTQEIPDASFVNNNTSSRYVYVRQLITARSSL